MELAIEKGQSRKPHYGYAKVYQPEDYDSYEERPPPSICDCMYPYGCHNCERGMGE